MRCATCGTENEPNSRFCGGCGARQPGSEPPRLAPTAKIPDDAAYPQQSARPVAVPQGPVSYAPPSIPPPALARAPVTPASLPAPTALSTPPPGSLARPPAGPASVPPTAQPTSAPPRAATRPQVSSASGSIDVPPRRPIGLMIALLVVDIGLAAAGAVLLSKGLAERTETKAEPAPVEKKTEAPAPGTPSIDQVASTTTAAPAPAAAAAPAAAPTTGTAAAAPSASTATSVAAREAPKRAQSSEPKLADKPSVPAKAPDAKVTDKPADKPIDKPADKPIDKPADTRPDDARPVGGIPTQPQDPHAAPNTEREIDAAAADSKATFAECATDHPGHGTIKIAFQVRYDGRVINAAAVENTTGNAELARCLIAEISSWRVSAHNGTSINLLRPFTYP